MFFVGKFEEWSREDGEINTNMGKGFIEEFHAKLQRGYDDYRDGRVQNAAEAFSRFRENHL